MENILIYGCGGVGNEIAEAIIAGSMYNLLGFIDDNRDIDLNMGFPCFTLADLDKKNTWGDFKIVVSVGEPAVRELLSKKIATRGFSEASLDFSSHFNDAYSNIGAGTVLHFGSYISVNACVGKSCLINKDALVGHDCIIGDFCVLSPRVTLGGNVSVGRGTYIGTNACIRNGIKIGKNSIIGMGAVVIRDVGDDEVVVGNPAKFIRKNDDKRVFKKTSPSEVSK